MRGVCLLMALGLAACRDPAQPLLSAKSGSRLHTRMLKADSARKFVGWHDTQLDVECSFAPDEAGVLRCMPGYGPEVVYLEASCKSPVALVSTSSCNEPLPRLFSTYLPGTCAQWPDPQPMKVFELGQPVQGASTYYALRYDGSCQPQQLGTNTLRRLIPTEPSRFVAGAVRFDRRDGDLGVDLLHADDGAFQALRLRDGSRDRPCFTWYSPTVDQGQACMPTRMGWLGIATFEDSTCSQAVSYQSVCVVPDVLVRLSPDSCGSSQLFERGPEATGTYGTLYDGGCGPSGDFAHGYLQGDPIDPRTLPWVGTEYRGQGRLQRLTQVGASKKAVREPEADDTSTSPFFDTQLGQACSPQTVPSGETRCVPDALEWSAQWYANPDCTVPLVQMPSSTCGAPAPRLTAVHGQFGCGPTKLAELRSIGEVYTGTVYQGPNCQEIARPVGAEFRSLSDPLELSTLATFDEVVE